MAFTLPTFPFNFQEENTRSAEFLHLQQEVTALKQEVVKWRAEANLWKTQHRRTKEREEQQKETIQQLKAKVRLREQQLFGKKSEKQKSKKDQKAPSENKSKKKRKRGQQKKNRGPKRRDFSHLEERVELIDLLESEKCCRYCGSSFVDTEMTSDSKQLEIEVKAHVRRIKRKQYRTTCTCQKKSLITASRIHKIIPKGLLGNSVWAHLLVEKYGYGIPLNRLTTSLGLTGLNLSQGTIIGGFHKLQPFLEPVFEAIKEKGLSESNWNVDETGWPVFEEVEEKSNYRWWLWVFRSCSTVFFLLDPARSSKVLDKYFDKKTSGIINCDRHKAYIKFVRLYEGTILLAFCWAHVRRDFLSLANANPQHEVWALEWIEKIRTIYHVNSLRILHVQGSREFRKHDRKLKNLISKFSKAISEQIEDKTLADPRKKALKSLKNHWKGLTIFVDHSEIPMDNNKGERSLRGPVIGRKNYYGSGSKKMGIFAVIMFSIIQTLLLWKINPKKWLLWYFSYCAKLGGTPPSIEEFLPWNMSNEKMEELCMSGSERPFAEIPDTS